MSDFVSILPPNATPVETALEQAMIEPAQIDLSVIETLYDPDHCPLHLLDWLAWAWSVDTWDNNWSEETKREVVRTSLHVHRVKGTVGAIERALGALKFSAEVREWFDHEGEPHTFAVTAYGEDIFASGKIDPALINTIKSIVENVKPLHTEFSIEIGQRFDVPLIADLNVTAHISRTDVLDISAPVLETTTACSVAVAVTHHIERVDWISPQMVKT